MSNTARVLIRVADLNMGIYNKKTDFLASVYRIAASEMEDWLGMEIGGIVPMYASAIDPSTAVIGAKEPEKLKAEAAGWNTTLAIRAKEAAKPLEQFQKAVKLQTFGDTLLYDDSEDAKREFQKITGQVYKDAVDSMHHALGMLGNQFRYGDDMLVISDLDDTYECNVKLMADDYHQIQSHPEEYVILNVLYN